MNLRLDGITRIINHRRLHASIGDMPPMEFETTWAALGSFAIDAIENRPPGGPYSPANDPGGIGHRAIHSAFASSATVGAEVNYNAAVVREGDREGVLSTNINPGG